MSDVTKEVAIRLKAIDESKTGFDSFTSRLRAIQQEQRASGEGALERTLRGGGGVLGLSMFAVEGAAKAAEGVRESIKGVEDGSLTVSEAWGHTIEKTADAVPVLSGLVKAFGELRDMAMDTGAAIDRHFGVDEGFIEKNVESESTVKKRYETINAAIADALKTRREIQIQADTESLRGRDRAVAEEKHSYDKSLESLHEHEKEKLQGINRFGDQYRKLIADYHSSEEQLERLHEEKLAKIDEDGNRQIEAAERAHVTTMAQIRAAVRSSQFAEAGLSADASEVQIRQHIREQLAASDTKRTEDLAKTTDPKERARIINESVQEQIELVKAGDDAIARAQREASVRQVEEQRKADDQVTALNVATQAERLKIAHQEGQAELLVLKAQHNQQLKEIERWQSDRLEKLANAEGPNAAKERSRVMREAAAQEAALRDKYDADVAAAQQREADRQTEQSQNAQYERDEARIGVLRAMGEAGNGLARQEAERLEITDRTEQKIADITKQLREQKDLTDGGRKNLEQAIQLLKQEEAIEIASVNRHAGDGEYRFAPGGQQGRGMVGIDAAAAIRMHNDEYERQKRELDAARRPPLPNPDGDFGGPAWLPSRGGDFDGLPGAGAVGYNEAASRRAEMSGRGSDFGQLASINQQGNTILERILAALHALAPRPTAPPRNMLQW